MKYSILFSLASLLTFAGCSNNEPAGQRLVSASPADPLAIALAPQPGESKSSLEIARLQAVIRAGKNVDASLERLGWLYVGQARTAFDPGYYKLAEACALALSARHEHSAEALLLRGHVLQNLHRFKEAESLARKVAEQRGLAADYGLLGDTLMEQGRLDEAVAAYQVMLDTRPNLDSYARAAHMRWLKGDLSGAIDAMRLAVSAASPLAPETAAWANTRLGFYLWAAGEGSDATRACDAACEFQPAYPPALLLRGRRLLAEGQSAPAIEALRSAERANPLPEYQWALAEALREGGRDEEARVVENRVRQRGPSADPRTCALFLATRGDSADEALRLAEQELQTRADVYTQDALAWALVQAGKTDLAWNRALQALGAGTQDPRLLFHAAVIASRAGRDAEARRWSAAAQTLAQLLLPSERRQLAALTQKLQGTAVATAAPDANSLSVRDQP